LCPWQSYQNICVHLSVNDACLKPLGGQVLVEAKQASSHQLAVKPIVIACLLG
jgi:hypothetical protein